MTSLPDREQRETRRRRRSLAVALMMVSMSFSGVVLGVMVTTLVGETTDTPSSSARMKRLQELLTHNPGQTSLREAIRDEDQRLRARQLQVRRRLTIGTYLLVAGLAGFVASARWYVRIESRPPMVGKLPSIPPRQWWTNRRRNVAAVAALGVALCGTLVTMGLLAGGPASGNGQGLALKPSLGRTYTDNWPGFRGPTGMGLAPEGDFPRRWNVDTGENVLWKVEVPLAGKSSPVIWADRIFLTGADDKRQMVFCFDRMTGKLLWQTLVRTPQSLRGTDIDIEEDTGYAAPTPVTDGQRLYVTFASADLAALDFDGNVLWSLNFGPPESLYGLASSPALHDQTLIWQLDRGTSVTENLSALLGLDPATGSVKWRTERPVINSWSSPTLTELDGRTVILTSGTPVVAAYDALNGTELWHVGGMSADVACSPVRAAGLVLVTNEGSALLAIRPDGRGDVTETHVVWRSYEGLPDAASPVSDGERVLQADGRGTVTCLRVTDGTLLWTHDFGTGFWSSPVLCGRTVYLTDRKGRTYLVDLADAFASAGEGTVGEDVDSSPAFADSRIYIRGKRRLFSIGYPEKP